MRRLLVNDDASGVGVSSAAAAAAEARARAVEEKHDSFLFRDSLLELPQSDRDLA